VKIKVGPITAQFKGQASFVEKDDAGRRAVLKAEGRDTGGKGNASALITALVEPDGDRSTCTVTTDLTITGKVAQFGRGALVDVSTKLLNQFVDCLEAKLAADKTVTAMEEAAVTPTATDAPAAASARTAATESATPERSSAPSDSPRVRKIDMPETAPVDLLDAAGAPLAKRLIPAGVVMIVLLWLVRRALRSRG
jgi:uncharacterized protein